MPNCYGVRMLNPYRGVMEVVETDNADAVSCDGVSWTLYVHGERERAQLDDGHWYEIDTPDVKFGIWSQEGGLKRAPVRNVVEYEFVDHIGLHLIDAVKAQSAAIPFPLQDHYELWLLDAAFDLPLALLGSTVDPEEISGEPPLRWRSGIAAREQFRVDERLAARFRGATAADAVERLVNNAAGARPRAQWFRRLPGGDGETVGHGSSGSVHAIRRLPARAFPEQQLRSHWPDQFAQALVRAYLDWQAPWLLMLSRLSDETRARLEARAVQRAMLLAEGYVLLPKVIDRQRITAARVEARLRQAAGERPQQSVVSDDAMFPFFNE